MKRAYYIDHNGKAQNESWNCVMEDLALLSLSHMRPFALKRFYLLLVSAMFLACHAQASQQVETEYGPLPVFEFHSGFWVNLHHTLYSLARERKASTTDKNGAGNSGTTRLRPSLVSPQNLTAAEQQAWDAAVSFYAENYADKDPLFNIDLMLLKNQLGDFEDCDELTGKTRKTCDAGLPGRVAPVLESVAPIFRVHWWPDQDRADRRWVARIAPLVLEQGVGVSERLADIYQTKWPKGKIRVEVSAYANSTGAYTTLDPLRVTISSTDPRNQGSAAFEVLFHEASHGIAQAVQAAIARECRQRNKAIPRDLWHALIFYTTGEVIKPLMAGKDPSPTKKPGGTAPSSPKEGGGSEESYTPYAIREGLYQRGWNSYLQLLTQFWQPYLDGKATFDDAIAHMASSL